MATAAAKAKPPGKGGTIVTMAVLTVLGIAGGGVVGKLIGKQTQAVPVAAPVAEVKPYSGDTEVKELPAVVTNLSDPTTTAVRLQAAIVYTKKPDQNLALLMGRINDDFVAYLKTLSLAQIQGASGLQSVREDLNERAAIRSQGLVREVIIETLVTQ